MNQYLSTNYWAQNGRSTVVVVLLFILITSLLYQQAVNQAGTAVSAIFRHNGVLYSDGVLLIHLIVDVDVLVRLLPYTGDPDLFAATGENREILISRLTEPHVPEILRMKSVYLLNTSWDNLINSNAPDDVYQLFSYQSATTDVEEFVVQYYQPNNGHQISEPQPILITVRPYPHPTDRCEFLIEVFPHSMQSKNNDQAEPNYEQLISQSVIPSNLTELEQLTGSSVADSADLSKPARVEKLELPESRLKIVWTMIVDCLNTLSPLFFSILEGIFDILIQ